MTRTAEVHFQNGGVTLRGTIHFPAGGGPRPGVVLVHGSGPRRRSDLAAHAEAFVRAGIVVLSYDKRTEGYSATRRDYSLLAGDVLAAVRLLAGQLEVDRGRVGVWGFSEGGWVAPLAASRSDEIAYVVVVGASGPSPSRQQAWALRSYLNRAGLRGAAVEALAEVAIRQLAGAGAFPEAHYDGARVLGSVRQRVLAIWGEHDQVVPPGESLRIFREALVHAESVTLKVIPRADHGVRGPDGLAPGYAELVTTWITGTAGAVDSDPPPLQAVRSKPIAPLAWWESTGVQGAALALFLAAFPGYLIGSGQPDRVARCAAVLGAATVGGWATYVVRATTAEEPDLGRTIDGRSVPWLALQGTAAATVVATAFTAARTRRLWRRLPASAKARRALLLAGGLAMVPWARYWHLLRRCL